MQQTDDEGLRVSAGQRSAGWPIGKDGGRWIDAGVVHAVAAKASMTRRLRLSSVGDRRGLNDVFEWARTV